MAQQIIIPHRNPVKFYKINPAVIPQYLSKNYDLHPYIETIKPWETKRAYAQPWMQCDNIRLQVEANFGPILLELIDQDDTVYYSQNMQQVLLSSGNDGYAIYEANLPLNIYPEGVYYLKLAGTSISEPLKILANQKNTVLLEYSHHIYTGDIIWATGFSPSIRVRGTIQPESPSSKDSFFEDQQLNLILEDSKAFDVSLFLIGGAPGIPSWFAKKLNRIMGCSTVKYDGIQYTKNADKLTPLSEKNYPMKSYSIELRDTINRESEVIEDGTVMPGRTSMIVIVNGEGFGMNNGNGSEQEIQIFS
jgi:hypothetical protein